MELCLVRSGRSTWPGASQELAAGGLPLRASERLAEEAGPGRKLFTSDLSVNEFLSAGAHDAGCGQPIAQVMGTSIYHIGQIPDYKGKTAELTTSSATLHRESRRLAVSAPGPGGRAGRGGRGHRRAYPRAHDHDGRARERGGRRRRGDRIHGRRHGSSRSAVSRSRAGSAGCRYGSAPGRTCGRSRWRGGRRATSSSSSAATTGGT